MVRPKIVFALPCFASSSSIRAPDVPWFFNVRTGASYSTWTPTPAKLTAVGTTFEIANELYDLPESIVGSEAKLSQRALCQEMMHCVDGIGEASSMYGRLLDVVPPAGALDNTEHTVISNQEGTIGNVHCHYVQGKYACHEVDVQLFSVVTTERGGARHNLKIACHFLSSNASMNGCHVALPGDLIFEGRKPVLI
jgi:hypothetical protein